MNPTPVSSPPGLFKGIALFTPGGDLIYCLDPQKRRRWHLQLCTALQEHLNLSAPPHFLVPCYTATLDRWWDVQTQTLQTAAEASPKVIKYAGLLNAVFGVQSVLWTQASCPEELCDPELINTYRTQFPELWQHHNLITQLQEGDIRHSAAPAGDRNRSSSLPLPQTATSNQGFVFRLFVSGRSTSTESILRKLHHALETSLDEPYTLKVIDVYRNPEQAEIDQITATPTLLKVWPLPCKRIVGNLDDMDQLLGILTLNNRSSLPPKD